MMEQKLDRVPTCLTLRATKQEWKNGYPFTVGENYRIRFGLNFQRLKILTNTQAANLTSS